MGNSDQSSDQETQYRRPVDRRVTSLGMWQEWGQGSSHLDHGLRVKERCGHPSCSIVMPLWFQLLTSETGIPPPLPNDISSQGEVPQQRQTASKQKELVSEIVILSCGESFVNFPINLL